MSGEILFTYNYWNGKKIIDYIDYRGYFKKIYFLNFQHCVTQKIVLYQSNIKEKQSYKEISQQHDEQNWTNYNSHHRVVNRFML